MFIERLAVRAVLLTPDNEILLLRFRPPDSHGCFWVTTGGGLEPGEIAEAGLSRELPFQAFKGLELFSARNHFWAGGHDFCSGELRLIE